MHISSALLDRGTRSIGRIRNLYFSMYGLGARSSIGLPMSCYEDRTEVLEYSSLSSLALGRSKHHLLLAVRVGVVANK